MIDIESLLYESEGTALDFKRDQYRFIGVTDPEKTELLKDILAFANAWRRTTAYVLIGVQENPGSRAIVHGITDHIDDAQLQQFVNGKTNRGIDFKYQVVTIEGKQVGVIEIPLQQRPIFLKKKLGELLPSAVYIRQGSSTHIADPDEIARMGISTIQEQNTPSLRIEFASLEKEILGTSIHQDVPRITLGNDIPDNEEPIDTSVDFSLLRANKSYYRDYGHYYRNKKLFFPLRFHVYNTGSVLIQNCRLIFPISKDILVIRSDERPKRPSRYHNELFDTEINPFVDENIERIKRGDEKSIQFKLGNIQPKDEAFSSPVYIASAISSVHEITIKTYADNLPEPKSIVLTLNITVTEEPLDHNQLLKVIDEDLRKSIKEYNENIRASKGGFTPS